MLENRLIIDNNDAFSAYGLFIRDNGLAPLIGWPQFKKVDTNNWYEVSGIEADLDCPVLDGRRVQLQMYSEHALGTSELSSIFNMLKGSVYHTFKTDLGMIFTLRYVNNGSLDVNDRFDSITLTLAEDSRTKPEIGDTVALHFGPLAQTFTIAVPASESVFHSGYSIDGYNMARFGVMVVKGSCDQMHKFDKVKEALKRSSNYVAGIEYDSTGTVYTQHDDVTLKLHMRTDSVLNFWKRWYALFATVMASGEHTLQGVGKYYRCYYKSMKVDKLYPLPDGGVWCDFSLTMAILGGGTGVIGQAVIGEDFVIGVS